MVLRERNRFLEERFMSNLLLLLLLPWVVMRMKFVFGVLPDLQRELLLSSSLQPRTDEQRTRETKLGRGVIYLCTVLPHIIRHGVGVAHAFVQHVRPARQRTPIGNQMKWISFRSNSSGDQTKDARLKRAKEKLDPRRESRHHLSPTPAPRLLPAENGVRSLFHINLFLSCGLTKLNKSNVTKGTKEHLFHSHQRDSRRKQNHPVKQQRTREPGDQGSLSLAIYRRWFP